MFHAYCRGGALYANLLVSGKEKPSNATHIIGNVFVGAKTTVTSVVHVLTNVDIHA